MKHAVRLRHAGCSNGHRLVPYTASSITGSAATINICPSKASSTTSANDMCNSHPTPLTAGYTWHHHGIPTCLTETVDTADGPSHIIGIALDGFPIYGGRDIKSSLNCYSGTVTQTQMTLAQARGCATRLARAAVPSGPPRAYIAPAINTGGS